MHGSICSFITWPLTNEESNVDDWDTTTNVVFRNPAVIVAKGIVTSMLCIPANPLPQRVILFVLIEYCHCLNCCA
jgi:hypothetical protein